MSCGLKCIVSSTLKMFQFLKGNSPHKKGSTKHAGQGSNILSINSEDLSANIHRGKFLTLNSSSGGPTLQERIS